MAVGVTFFFVLSGFILTYVYQDIEKPGKLFDFYSARIARAWPLHIATFLLAFFLLSSAHTLMGQTHYFVVTILNILLLHAWIPVPSVFFSYNAVAWAMSIELFFYLIFPFLAKNWSKTLFIKSGITFLFLAVYLGIINQLTLSNDMHQITLIGAIGVIPFTRLAEFIFGMLAAQAFINLSKKEMPGGLIVWSLIELLVIFGSYYSASYIIHLARWIKFSPNGPVSVTWGTYLAISGTAPVFMVVIIIFAFQKGIITKILSKNFFVFLGELSFSIYLLHNILMLIMASHRNAFSFLSESVLFFLYCGTVLLSSFCLWKYIQKPSRKFVYNYLQKIRDNRRQLKDEGVLVA